MTYDTSHDKATPIEFEANGKWWCSACGQGRVFISRKAVLSHINGFRRYAAKTKSKITGCVYDQQYVKYCSECKVNMGCDNISGLYIIKGGLKDGNPTKR